MLFQPEQVTRIWDTWAYYKQGTYYMFYLITEHSPGEGIGLAVSTDGVNWRNQGTIMTKSEDAVWLGTGAVWKNPSGDGYLMNFSEWHGDEKTGQQTIYFAGSTDLLKWERLPDATFPADPLHYVVHQGSLSRWDCIYPLTHEKHMLGFWTANPLHRQPGFGMGYTVNGARWHALPAPEIDWGDAPVPDNLELGAVEPIGGRYYALVGIWNYGGRTGMYVLSADHPEGPYRAASRNYALLTSITEPVMSYFVRFLRTPAGLLAHHHVVSWDNVRRIAPLKRVIVEQDGMLCLAYWEGNHKLKGEKLLSTANEGRQAWPLSGGIVAEGVWERRMPACSDEKRSNKSGNGASSGEPSGLAFQFVAEDGTPAAEITVSSRGDVCFLERSRDSGQLTPIDRITRDHDWGSRIRIRLLARDVFLELYLNDYLIQCYSLKEEPAAGSFLRLRTDDTEDEIVMEVYRMSR